MLIFLLTLLLISNALSLSKDKSILFSRIVMVSLILTSILGYNNLFVLSLDKGIGIYGGLLHVTAFTHSFNTKRFIISATILTLTTICTRKVYLKVHFSSTSALGIVISIFILIFLVFMYTTNVWLNIANILTIKL